MKRIFVIGDIHGGFKALQQVLQRAEVTPEDTLIFLGDYVDGWSEAAETIACLMELQESNDCVFIKGNHDAWCEAYLKTGQANETWLYHGGEATYKSYQLLSAKKRNRHLSFFENMPYYHIDSANRLFVHAGFSSMHGPKKETHQTTFFWDRTLWEMAVCMNEQLDEKSILYPIRLRLFKEIYIGHTPTLNFSEVTPMNAINVWNIDTGAGFTGKLSIMDIDTKAYWQSDNLPALYSDEKGRN